MMAGKKKKSKAKYIWYSLGGLILLFFIAKSMGLLSSEELQKVTVQKVEKRDIVETVSATGKVQPEMEVKISADVSGEIVELFVKEGDTVTKGQVLLKINPDLSQAAKDRAMAALNTAKANEANAKARMAQVNVQYLNGQVTFKRNEKLHKQGAISQAEFETAQTTFAVSEAEKDAAFQSAEAARYNVENARAALKEAENSLSRTTIMAPMDGTVSLLREEKGNRVVGTLQMTGTEIMRIANLSNMEVQVDVNENDIVKVSRGDSVDIEVDAYLDKTFKGIVTEIAKSANSLDVLGGSMDQVTNFSVKIRVLQSSYQDLVTASKPHPFLPGLSANVEIKTGKVSGVLSVPIQAVTTREDSLSEEDARKKRIAALKDGKKKEGEEKKEEAKEFECVFVYADGKVLLRKVKTGIQDNEHIEIVSGLKAEDKVVVAPYRAIRTDLHHNDKVEQVSEDEVFRREEE